MRSKNKRRMISLVLVFVLLFQWSAVASASLTPVPEAEEGNFTSIAYGNGTFVAVSFNPSLTYYSTDGLEWNQGSFGSGGAGANEVFYHNDQFIALGTNGNIYTSTDGIEWDSSLVSMGAGLNSIAYGDEGYIIAASMGNVFHAKEGTSNWGNFYKDTSNRNFFGIAYGNGIYVVVGDIGTLLTIEDTGSGLDWTIRDSGTTNSLNDVQYFNDQFHVVGANGTYLTSPDGEIWTPQTLPDEYASAYLMGITYEAGTYVVVGGKSILSSSNGVVWKTEDAGNVTFRDVIYDAQNGHYIIVGVNKMLYYIPATANSSISPTTGEFDKNVSERANITVTLTFNGNTLDSVSNAGMPLTADADYELSGNQVIIKKEYLAQQDVGTTTLTFEFSAGQAQDLTIEITDSTNAAWSYTFQLPGTFDGYYGMGTAYLDGKIYVGGGMDSSGHIFKNDFWAYDVSTGQWEELSKLPSPTRAAFTLAPVNGKLYLVGGIAGPNYMYAQIDAHVYEPGTDSWSPVADLGTILNQNAARYWHQAAVVQDKMYILQGGFPIEGNVLEFNTLTGTWFNHSDSSNPSPVSLYVQNFASAAVEDKVYLFGSFDPMASLPSDQVSVYDTSNNTVGSVPPFTSKANWEARYLSAAAALPDGKVMVIGGNDGKHAIKTVSVYNPSISSWEAGADIPSARTRANALVVPYGADTYVYLIGGIDASGNPVNSVIRHKYIPSPIITEQPQDRDAVINGKAEFEVTVKGSNLNYQWQVDTTGLGLYTDIQGETSKRIRLSKISQEMDGYRYRVIVSNKGGSVTSTPATLTVLPDIPPIDNEIKLSALAGNEEVKLNWNTVTGATYYEVYMATKQGGFAKQPTWEVSGSSFTVKKLTNGQTYHFLVKAGDGTGWSVESNQAKATPAAVPSAPTGVTAAAGDQSATVTFIPPTDKGGSDIIAYHVKDELGNNVGKGGPDDKSILITHLTNGKTYTFTVSAVSAIGSSLPSLPSNPVTPTAPSNNDGDDDDNGSPTDPETPPGGGGNDDDDNGSAPTPNQPGPSSPGQNGSGGSGEPTDEEGKSEQADVWVNGQAVKAGVLTSSVVNRQTVTTLAIDEEMLRQRLEAEGHGAVISIVVDSDSEIVVGELNGRILKQMEALNAVIELRTPSAVYTLPAGQLDISQLSGQLGAGDALENIRIKLEIGVPSRHTQQVVSNALQQEGVQLAAAPLNFGVTAEFDGQTVEVTRFTEYVERTFILGQDVDPNRITTGVVVEPDGTVRHVPTQVTELGGVYYAHINSLTNSTYALVWNPVEFADVSQHWAKDAVNNLGSRMIVNGTDQGVFSPDLEITRAEFAAILVRGLGLAVENGPDVFTDVRTGDWYYGAIQTAYNHGLIHGMEDGTFRPTERITREQAMLMISHAMQITGLDVQQGGSVDTLLDTYLDGAEVSAWARQGVANNLQAGLVSGRGNGELAPRAFITRAEVVRIVEKLLEQSDLI